MDTPDLNADTWDAGANRWTLCANSENQLVQVDPITEANSCANPYSFRQSGTSQPQNIPNTEKKIVGTATNRPERKRINDKAYRQRQKEGRIKLEDDFRNLHEENAYLKTENECLKKENCMLKRTISDQQVPVDTFMQKPVNDDHQLVVTQLENKISLLSAEKEQLLERVKNLENQNQVPRVQVEAFCEQINNVKDNEDIQAWGHVEELPNGHFKCKFCGHDGDSPRIKSHLEGVKGCDIEIGTKVPIDVQAATYLAIGGPNKKAKIMSSLSNFEQSKTDSTSSLSLSNDLRQATLLELCKKKDKSALDKLLTELLLLNYIEFNVVQTPPFNRFVQGVAEYGPGYELPSYSTLCMKLIPDSKMEVEEYIRNVKKSWVTTGCTLMFQRWSNDYKLEFYTNIIAYSPGGAVFIKSCQIDDLEDNVVSIITEEIGPDHVVQVITDDGHDVLDLYDDVVCTILGKYPRIYHTWCTAHGIDILLEVDWVCRVINYASSIASYMYEHATILSLMRDYTNNRDLKHSCMTRFVCGYQMLKSIFDVANELRLLVRSSQWRGLGDNKDEAKEVTDIIQSTEFWSQGSEVLQALEPLVHVVLLIDNDGPTSGYLYEAMERAKEAIKHRRADNPAKYMQIWELLEGWYTKEIIHPTHAAAAFLNPAYMCRENFREDNMMKAGICFILRNLVDTEEQDDFQSQLEVYRMKNSRLFTSTAMANLKTHHPRIWWEYFGDSLPIVRKYAIRILSQPCSTFLCKRDLNDFRAVQIKYQYKSEREGFVSLEESDILPYTTMNTMMMEKFSTLKARDLKPIDLDKLLVNFDCNQVCGGYCFYGLDFDGNIF